MAACGRAPTQSTSREYGGRAVDLKVEEQRELFSDMHDKLHRQTRDDLESVKNGRDPKSIPISEEAIKYFGNHNIWEGAFFSKLPQVAIDYYVNPYIHIFERAQIAPKTMALCLVSSYLSREPKDKHGIFLWSSFAKACGATDDEIMEVAAVAMLANGKYQMKIIDDVMSEVFQSEMFKDAAKRTK